MELYLTDEAAEERDLAFLQAIAQVVEVEHGNLSAEINAKSLTQDQIRTLQELTSQVATGLNKADKDFSICRNIIEILDVEAKLNAEDREQITYTRCVFDKESLGFRDSLSGGVERHKRPLPPGWIPPIWTGCC